MPATGQTNIGEGWKSADNKQVETAPYNEATDMENPVAISEDENAPPDDDSTYNLEDDVTPPNVTPYQSSGSKSESDGTGDSVEEIQTDSSGEIIPKYLFQLPSSTRALNIEFNRCLLLDLDPLPSTSWMKEFNDKKKIEKEDIDTFPAAGVPKTERSSSSDSSQSPSSKPSKKHRKRITRISEEKCTEEAESVATDCEVKSDRSSDETRCSVSLDSTESDKIIPSFLFRLLEDVVNPELELCLDFEDDSRATDNDVTAEQSFSAKTDLYFEEDHYTKELDDTEQIQWIESELDENKKPSDDLHSKALSAPTDTCSESALSQDSRVFFEDSEPFIPRYLFA